MKKADEKTTKKFIILNFKILVTIILLVVLFSMLVNNTNNIIKDTEQIKAYDSELIINDINEQEQTTTSDIQNSEDIETQEFNITNTYIGPEISANKTYETENGKEFVVEGEKITYTIAVENAGGMEKEVIIQDKIPVGTRFVKDSIKINGQVDIEKKATDIANGIAITVPKSIQEEEVKTNGRVTLSFTVQVNNLEVGEETKVIENTAIVDGEPTQKTQIIVKKNYEKEPIYIKNVYAGPIIASYKTYETENKKPYVVEGEKITYKIVVENSGEIGKNVVIKDTIPEGTTFVEGSIRVNGEETYIIDGNEESATTKTKEELQSGIKVNVPAKNQENGKTILSFTVQVDILPETQNRKTIINVATVDNIPTEKVVVIVEKEIVEDKHELSILKKANDTKEVLEGAEFTITPNILQLMNRIKATEIKPKFTLNCKAINEPKDGNAYALNERIKFELTIKNTGNIELTDINVSIGLNEITNTTSTLIATLIEQNKFKLSKNLLPGESKVITFEYLVTEEDITLATIDKDINVDAKTVTPSETEISESIKIVGNKETVGVVSNAYEFEKEGESYKSNNKGKSETRAISYVPIDLTGTYKGKNTLVVNAQISSEEKDYGYAIITEKEITEEYDYNDLTEAFIAISGNREARDYKITLQGGKKYNLIFEYVKDGDTDLNEDAFTINNVKLIQNESGEEEQIKVNTNAEGKATAQLSYGRYTITETKAPQRYSALKYPVTIDVGAEENKIIENRNQSTLGIEVTGEGDILIENEFKEIDAQLESLVDKETSIEKVTSKDSKVPYKITFTSTIENLEGKAKIKLVDTLPYPLDKEAMEAKDLDNGKYEETQDEEGNNIYTIIWEEERDINTYKNEESGKITIVKNLNLKFAYGDINEMAKKLINTVTSHIELLRKENRVDENPEYEKVEEQDKEDKLEIPVEIPSKVVVHHYLYDEETQTETTIKLAEDEENNGIVGQEYETTPSNEVPANYECKEVHPDKYRGKYKEEQQEVFYYYSLITPEVSNEIEKTAQVNKIVQENEVPPEQQILTKEDGTITYTIKYVAKVTNYIGRVTVEIVDKLPAKIDINKSKLNGGVYNEKNNTITWAEELIIDTYANNTGEYNNGTYTKEYIKEIQIVYVDQDVTKDLVNEVTGKTKIYYPDNHPTKPEEEWMEEEALDEQTVKQEYKANLKVVKVWIDNNDLNEARPQSIIAIIKEKQHEDEKVVELNEKNNWTYEEFNLPKYDETGRKLEYIVTEKEVNAGELKYYEEAEVKELENQTDEVTNYEIRIQNRYKLYDADLNTTITKEGTNKITSVAQKVQYTIHFKTEISYYEGNAKVTIIDKLPYKIDTEKTDMENGLDGGIYDEISQTITWEEELKDLNVNKDDIYTVDITKKIEVVYKDIDVTAEKMTNEVTGKIELDRTGQYDKKDTIFDTQIDIKGTVKVKYVDIDTGEEISDRDEITDKVGKPYTTQKRDIENYEYVKDSGNTEGTIREEEQEVIYYYKRPKTKITVKYQDKDGNPLTEDEIKNGRAGDKYTTEEKEFDDYILVEVAGDSEGEMSKEEKEVIYVYEKAPAELEVKYLEKGTDKELLPNDELKGLAGDDYKTERKEVKYYKAVEPEPENANGKFKKQKQTVIYYYEKMEFNIAVEKELKSVVLNGEEKYMPDKKIIKVEIVAGNIKQANLEVTYRIKVSNTGEIDGKAKIKEILPKGYTLVDKSEYWLQSEDGNLEAMLELKVGEIKYLEVTLRWQNGDTNFGLSRNTAKIVDTENEANFEDINEKDDISEAEIITSIKTGVEENIIVIVSAISLAIVLCILVYVYEQYNRKKGRAVKIIGIESGKIVVKKDILDKH